jgi:hypothetical protein
VIYLNEGQIRMELMSDHAHGDGVLVRRAARIVGHVDVGLGQRLSPAGEVHRRWQRLAHLCVTHHTTPTTLRISK